MKEIYKPHTRITVNFKTGISLTADSDYSYRPYKFRYGHIPKEINETIYSNEIDKKKFELKNKCFSLIKGFGKDRKDRDYLEVLFTTGLQNVYYDEVQHIYIEETYDIYDVDAISIKTLENDLGFRGYSELWFDRWKELQEKHDSERLAEIFASRD